MSSPRVMCQFLKSLRYRRSHVEGLMRTDLIVLPKLVGLIAVSASDILE